MIYKNVRCCVSTFKSQRQEDCNSRLAWKEGRKDRRKAGRKEGSQEDRKGRLVAVLLQVNRFGIQAYGMTFLELDVTEEEIHGQAYVVFDCFCLEIA